MNYFKYLSRDGKTFYIHVAKILGICAIVLVVLKLIFNVELTWGDIALCLLNGAVGILLIWLLYAAIEYPHYRKFK